MGTNYLLGVYKINSNGSFDSSFGTNGCYIYSDETISSCLLDIKSDGTIITGGYRSNTSTADITKIELSDNGVFQNVSFFDIKQSFDIFRDVVEQADGKLVVLVNNSKIIRFNIDGSVDTSFGSDGIIDLTPFVTIDEQGSAKMIQQHNGKILIYFPDLSQNLYRINADGSPDSTFGTNGILLLEFVIENIFVTVDDEIFVSCFQYNINSSGILKLFNDGTIDNSFCFNNNNNFRFDYFNSNEAEAAFDLRVQSDNKIVMLTYIQEINNNYYNSIVSGLARFYPDGTLDTNFGTNGKLIIQSINKNTYPKKIDLLENDNLIVSTNIENDNNVLYKLSNNGVLDSNFNNSAINIDSYSTNSNFIIQPDLKIIKATRNNNQFNLERYDNITGELDNTFGINGTINTPINVQSNINQITWLQNNTLLASGTTYNGSNGLIALARYTDLNLSNQNFTSTIPTPIVYPNPFLEEFTLEYYLQNSDMVSIEIIDLQGKVVQTILKNKEFSQGSHLQKINSTSALSSGSYILKLSTTKESQSIMILKK